MEAEFREMESDPILAVKVIAIIGSSALEKGRLVEGLIEAFRRDGYSVSVIKRAPDGFDMDQPGKGSYERRRAGAREVMMATDERFVLLHENGVREEPDLESLVARLAPVDLVIAEGFHDARAPTIEALRPSSGRAPRHPGNPDVVALVSEEPLEAPLRVFTLDDIPGLADFMARRVGLRSG